MQVGEHQTYWIVARIHPALRIPRGPTGGILKQSDGADASIRTKIEPVPHAFRNSEQVAALDFDDDDRTVFRVNMKQTAAADNKPHFVFVVPMLAAELSQHRIDPRRSLISVDPIAGAPPPPR